MINLIENGLKEKTCCGRLEVHWWSSVHFSFFIKYVIDEHSFQIVNQEPLVKKKTTSKSHIVMLRKKKPTCYVCVRIRELCAIYYFQYMCLWFNAFLRASGLFKAYSPNVEIMYCIKSQALQIPAPEDTKLALTRFPNFRSGDFWVLSVYMQIKIKRYSCKHYKNASYHNLLVL